jgi:signal transduction histidine kinase
VELIYDDFGKKFLGSTSRLGELFYKFDSTKGSGIGLYLIKNLMRKMNGNFEIVNSERLKLKLSFESAEGGQDA